MHACAPELPDLVAAVMRALHASSRCLHALHQYISVTDAVVALKVEREQGFTATRRSCYRYCQPSGTKSMWIRDWLTAAAHVDARGPTVLVCGKLTSVSVFWEHIWKTGIRNEEY
jgi:hypothetical protein